MKRKLTLIFVCLLLIAGASAQRTRQTDSLALVELYHATGGPAWAQHDNWLTGSLGSWYGVSTQVSSGRVDSLRLCANNLRGELPDALIGLDSLQFLLMQDNYLYGHIPLLGKIPYYVRLKEKLIDREDYPCNQCQPLTGNCYQFAEIAADNSVLKGTYYNTHPYIYCNKSRTFSNDTVIVLQEGNRLEMKFNYRAHTGLVYRWLKDGMEQAKTDIPTLHIASFNSAVHAGLWRCEILRDVPAAAQPGNAEQYSGYFKLVSVNNQSHPKIRLRKSYPTDWKDTEVKNKYIRTFSEAFPPLNISATSASALPKQIEFEIVKTPMQFTIAVIGEDFPNVPSSPEGDEWYEAQPQAIPNALIPTDNIWTGYNSYTLFIQAKQPNRQCTDTLVVRVTDPSGRATQDTFLLESAANDSIYRQPVLRPGTFSTRTDAQGTWLRWHGLSSGVERLHISASLMPAAKECYADYDKAVAVYDRTISAPQPADSIHIKGLATEAGKNTFADIAISAENRTGFGDNQTISLQFKGVPIQRYPTGKLDHSFSASDKTLYIYDNIKTGCFDNFLWQSIDGKLLEPVLMWYMNEFSYVLAEGHEYRFWLSDRYGFYVSDTVSVSVPMVARKPVFTGGLSWSVGCTKTVRLNTIIKTDVAFAVSAGKGKHCTASADASGIYLATVGTWQGADTLPLRFTAPNGWVTDTFALISYLPNAGRDLFTADTVRLSLDNIWVPFSIDTYLAKGISSADIELAALRCDSIRFRKQFSEIRPIAYSVYVESIRDNLFINFKGNDTVLLECRYPDCSRDTLVIIASCRADIPEQSSLPFIDQAKAFTIDHDYFQRDKSLPFEGWAFYAGEPDSFPTRVDIRSILLPGIDTATLKYRFSPQGKAADFVDFTFDGPYVTVRPKKGIFYDYQTQDKYGSWSAPVFQCAFSFENEAGEADYYSFSIYITERPVQGQDTPEELRICGHDTLKLDVFGKWRSLFGDLGKSIDWSDESNGTMSLGKTDDAGYGSIWIKEELLYPTSDKMRFLFGYTSPFEEYSPVMTYNIITKDYNLTLLPTCDAPPVLTGIPVQNIGRTPPQLDLWAYLDSKWPAASLVWEFSGGDSLSWGYDYTKGALTALPKNAGWEGTDTISVTVSDINGFKSSTNIIYTTGATEIRASSCGSYVFGGKVLTSSGVYSSKFKSISGGDSIVILTLTIYPEYTVHAAQSVAYGQAYVFGTQKLTKSGNYTEIFKSVHGCDSTVTLSLTVLPEPAKITKINVSSCESYSFAGHTLTSSGIYRDSLKAVSGTDSTVILTLTISPVYNLHVSKSVQFGQTYQFGTQILAKTGTYSEIFKSVNGCDSTVTLDLTVLPQGTKLTEIEETECASFLFAGKTLTVTGVYTDTLKTPSGADSIVVLSLTINPGYNITIKASKPYGESIMLGSQKLTETGIYTEVFTTVHGCDSTVTLELEMTAPVPFVQYDTMSLCQTYDFAGQVISKSGDYADTVRKSGFVVFIRNLHFTRRQAQDTVIYAEINEGQTYNFGGITLTTTGVYTRKPAPVFACDSTVTLYLTVLPEGTKLTNLTKAACGEYSFAGINRTASGIYKDTLKTVSGADSIIVLTLTVNPVYNLQATKSVAFGQTYLFGTQILSQTGSYTETFQSINGCDSTVTLAFTVLPNSAPHITMSVKTFSLSENSANGTAVATITATDSEGAVLTYSISGSAAFAIDPATGAVTVKDSALLDYETAKSLTFTVRVSDGTAYDEAEITVMLTDVVETGLPMNAESVIIFPNTFSDRLSISATAFHGTVLVTAQNGAEVYSAKFGGYTDINTRNWPAGSYTVSIVSGTEVYSETIIKE